jgi:Tol biopolymer transport system component
VYRGGTYARYLSSGHLAFVRGGTLFAMPFDLDRLEAPGPPVRIVDGVVSNALSGAAQYDVSPTGTLVYLSGATGGSALPLQWMDRSGRLTMLRQTPAPWFTPRIAPDGKRIAMQLFDRRSDIWIYDASRDTITPLSSDQAVHSNPVWTPNGRRLVWSTPGADRIANLYWRLVDGGHEAQRLTTSPNTQYATFDVHPDGSRFVLAGEREGEGERGVVFVFDFFDELRRLVPAGR